MFCSNCGTQLAEGSAFCPNCGMRMEQPGDGNDYANPSVNGPQTPAPYGYDQLAGGQYGYNQENAPEDKYRGFPMNWHKFLVYFSLWAGAFLNALSGIMSLSGAQYDMTRVGSEAVYSLLPSLKAIDQFNGVFMLIIAVFTVFTAIRLLKLKRGAPRWLMVLYIVSLVGTLVYAGLADKVLRDYGSTRSIIGESFSNILISAGMIIINYIYYKKREELFVN